jgi:hypothetical protein
VQPAFIDPTATDNCTGAITLKAGYPITGAITPGANCTSSQTRTWIYVDACGNESLPFVQTATWSTDIIVPTVTGQTTVTGTQCNVQPAFIDPTATDNCTGAITLKAGYPITGAITPGANCTSSQTRTWIYVDACGNESLPFVQTATWSTDIIVPTVTGQTTVTGTQCNVQPAFIDPTATDNCTGAITLKAGYPITGAITPGANCTSSQTRTWIYVDACGNESLPFVQTATWSTDIIVPTVAGQTTVTGTQCNVQPAFIDPTATDNCTGAITLKAGYPITGAITPGANCTSSQTRTWIYVDACGNESLPFVQTATWSTDIIVPTVTGQTTVTGTQCNVQPAFIDPTATDNCTGAITLKAGYPITGAITPVPTVLLLKQEHGSMLMLAVMRVYLSFRLQHGLLILLYLL